MYRIITKDNEPLPPVDVIPLRLIVHPKLSDSIVLIAFLIREYLHDPLGVFEKRIFQRITGMKRRSTDNAISQLIDMGLLSIYQDVAGTVYELDYTTLIELLTCDNQIKQIRDTRGQRIKSILDKKESDRIARQEDACIQYNRTSE